MSDIDIVRNMIEYIENAEKDLQASKISLNDQRKYKDKKNAMVPNIIKELDKQMEKEAEVNSNED